MEKQARFNRLLAGKPLIWQGVVFTPTTIDEIIEMGTDNFDRIFYPFALIADSFKNAGDLSVFECIIRTPSVLADMMQGLKKLTAYQSSRLFTNRIELFWEGDRKQTLIIDKNNFDELADLVCLMQGLHRQEQDKFRTYKDPKLNDAKNKILQGRKRVAERNAVHFCDMLNICLWGGEYMVPRDIIMSMSMWELMNLYKNKVGIKNYNDELRVAIASGDGKSVSGNNFWLERVKIGT